MSVPLDRLYNFLYDVASCNDLLIYQFSPHGSRKLEDLVDVKSPAWPWFKLMTCKYMIFHDQEHLIYSLYTQQDFKDYLVKKYPYGPDKLLSLVSNMSLRACVTTTSNVYDQTLLVHSEQNSHDLTLYEKHGFIGVYFWSHALISRDWFRYAEHDPELKTDFASISHDFLIYNRAWSGTREYRLTLTEMLVNNNLVDCCKTTFSEHDNQLRYTGHSFTNPSLAISRDDLHTFFPANTHDANASADYNNRDYVTTAIEVVLETLFDECKHHLTEKTLRPIACGRPFILVSTPGSLQYLKQYGFETFNGLIDETYDTVDDARERLSRIVMEMQRISNLSLDQKQQLWTELYAIAERNKQRFFSTQWHDSVVQEFKDNFDSAVAKMTVSGYWQQQIDHLATQDPNMTSWRNSGRPGLATDIDRVELARWIQQYNSNAQSNF